MAAIAKLAGSFDKVLASCKSIGAQYQPNVPQLSVAALSRLQERAQQMLGAATVARSTYRLAVSDRKQSFDGLTKLAVRITRVMSIHASENEPYLEDARQIKNMLYPVRRRSSLPVSGEDEQNAVVRKSGRTSYDQQLETFRNLVELVARSGCYDPVEPDMTIGALLQKLAELRRLCTQVHTAKVAYKKACVERDQVFLGKGGVLHVTRAIKRYISGAFGNDSDTLKMLIAA